ncbi:SDR family oxidoreductase [Candidatus Woesebacteria bacterium]|nr:SDR family oxidoreductase [Candidatus Woesebacteria bacterium]MCD8507760.1 SDR family oxidoreductase [Candidatus Woesebacteria bacterium]MCD8526650.1 SDR family oxidoreductase [Candidatus Woesebacteria bacterium]MCD8545882.1 SDR family oxidoreductase [Candidatus Woesebacteria bacterium]
MSPDIDQHEMQQEPEYIKSEYRGSGKLTGKVALISGGDSGIGRSVSVYFAREGADVAILYHESDTDAQDTKALVESEGQRCEVYSTDVSDSAAVDAVVENVLADFGQIDILVNNAAIQNPQHSLLDISDKQLHKTFQTNIYGYFYLAKAVLPHLGSAGCIINTASVVAYRGHDILIDYSATKGAIVSFTRSLSLNLAPKNIRVNAVAPGPIWTPLIPSTFSKEKVEKFGKHTPLGRPGQPSEVAPAYVFLASNESSYITGQVIHVNGGEVVNA